MIQLAFLRVNTLDCRILLSVPFCLDMCVWLSMMCRLKRANPEHQRSNTSLVNCVCVLLTYKILILDWIWRVANMYTPPPPLTGRSGKAWQLLPSSSISVSHLFNDAPPISVCIRQTYTPQRCTPSNAGSRSACVAPPASSMWANYCADISRRHRNKRRVRRESQTNNQLMDDCQIHCSQQLSSTKKHAQEANTKIWSRTLQLIVTAIQE